MGKGLKRVLAAMLGSVMLFSAVGCSSGSNSKKMGRYVEERYETPNQSFVENLTELEDGTIAMTGYGKAQSELMVYNSADGGKSWTERNVELPAVEGMEVYPTQAKILRSGDIFIGYVAYEPYVPSTDENGGVIDKGDVIDKSGVIDKGQYKEPETKYILIDKDGNKKDIEIKSDDNNTTEGMYYGQPSNFKSGKDGNIYYQSSSGTEIVQLDGTTWEEKKRFSSSDYIESYILLEKSLILWSYAGIVEFELESGTDKGNLDALEKETVKSTSAYYAMVIDAVSKDKIYYYSTLGLYSYDINKKESKLLIDGAISSFGNRDSSLSGFIERENGDFLTVFNDWAENKGYLINFSYDPNIPSEPENQIRVYSLVESEATRQAVSAFAKANPDVYVKYEVGLTWGDGVTEADALKKLNTEIMAGNGPDVLLLDNLPISSYVEKGLLEDISSVINEYSNNGNLFKGMVDAYTVDGKIYQFPTSFKFPILLGNKDVINKITDLNSLRDTVKELGQQSDRRIFAEGTDPKSMVYSLYYLYGNDWLNKDRTINEDNLYNFLTAASEIYTVVNDKNEKYYEKMNEIWKKEKQPGVGVDMPEIGDGNELMPDISIPEGGVNPDDSTANIYQLVYGLIPYAYTNSFLYEEEPAHLVYGAFTDNYSYGTLISVISQFKDMDYKVLTRGEENIFAPMDVMGVNAKSKQKDVAKRFIKEALSEKVQGTGWREGLQVNKNALENKFKFNKDDYYDIKFDEETKRYYFENMKVTRDIESTGTALRQYFANEDDIKDLLSKVDKLNVAGKIDRTLLMEVAKEFQLCITEGKSIDDAIDTIVDNLDLYLSE